MVKIDVELAEKVALACNILAIGGHGDFTAGHVTGREPGQNYLHMKSRGLGLDEITAKDILVIDLEGNKVAGSAGRHSEYPIHTEIYKMYPETNCVIHTHPFFSIIVGSTGENINVISNVGAFFSDIPVFSETTQLVSTPELGKSVAGCLNGHMALILRNHGVVVRGSSIEEATVQAILLEKAAKFHVMAAPLGPCFTSSPEEILKKKERILAEGKIKDTWDYCVRKLKVNSPMKDSD